MTSSIANQEDLNQKASKLVPPHGSSELKPLLLKGDARKQALKLASTLPTISLSSRERGDLIMLGIGGFTPLNGFMNQADWQGVVCACKVVTTLACFGRFPSLYQHRKKLPTA